MIICGFASVAGWFLIFLSSIFSLYAIYPGLFLLGWSCGLSNPLKSIYVSEIAGSGNKGMITTYVVDIFSYSSISEFVVVLVTGFSEMGFSFLQMVIADKVGR